MKLNFRTTICEVDCVKSTVRVYHYFSLNRRPITWYNHVCMVEHTRLTLIRNLFFFYSHNEIVIQMGLLTRVCKTLVLWS